MPSYGGFDSTIEVLAKFYPMMMMLITQYSLFDPNRDVYSTKGTGHWGTTILELG